ncbi:response regulator transcription factor [Taibaiella lutea]|nr:helix-turn-helix transcriptional regulator [Taibaiella lutea]
MIIQKINEIDGIADDIPGVVIIHLIEDLSVQYISKRGQAYLGRTLDEIKMSGPVYYNYFNKEDLDDYLPKVKALFDGNKLNESVSYFQQVRRDETMPWSWHFSTSKILMQSPDGNPLLSITISLPVDAEQHVNSKLERLLEEYIFFRKNRKLFLNLTVREKEILRLLALSKSAKEIARELVISSHTVETHRKNLRKKLNITSNYQLNKFALAFDLI